MGRVHGPPPKPTAIKILEGNPGKHKLNATEPHCRELAPWEAPTWMDKIAAAEYRRVHPLLECMGLLTKVDTAALEAYCDAYSTMVRTAMIINQEGMTFMTETGQLKPRPEVNMKAQASQIVRQFCIEFGLTPSSRGRMHTGNEGEEDDGMERLLNQAKQPTLRAL